MITCARHQGNETALNLGNKSVLVDRPATLVQLSRQLDNAEFVALDTEFVRERTYFPKLCLLQLATPDSAVCVDVWKLGDISPLLEKLFDKNIVKVLHSGRQDLELLFHLTGRVPAPAFDTQIAMGLLGVEPQISYSAMVHKLFGRSLDKSHTRTDWTRRPLTPSQLRYALDDVEYLARAYPCVRENLESRGRLDWHREDCDLLARTDLYEPQPEASWQRIRGTGSLDPEGLTALKCLSAWRELEAMERDRPRQWILSDAVLVRLAKCRPGSGLELEKIKDLRKSAVQRYSTVILEILNRSASIPQTVPTDIQTPPDPVNQTTMGCLRREVRRRAAELGIDPSILAPRSELKRLLRNDPDCLLVSGWRFRVLGNQLLQRVSSDTT